MAGTAATPTFPTPAHPISVTPIPMRQFLPYALFGTLIALILLYFVGSEQGALSVFSGTGIHEWVHDGRHLLGFPCH